MAKAKYRNKPVVVDCKRFDSQAEAVRYSELKLMMAAGVITDLRLQVPFVLAPGVRLVGASRATPALRYFADFVYRKRDGSVIIEDVKGALTEAYKIKRHLMALQGHHITEIKA